MSSKKDMEQFLKKFRRMKENKFRSRLKSMKGFVEKMEKMLALERTEHKNRMDQVEVELQRLKDSGESEEFSEGFLDHLENQGIDLDMALYFEENIFRKPIVSSLYFFLESELNDMCDFLYENKSLAKKLAECKKSDLEGGKCQQSDLEGGSGKGRSGSGSGIMKACNYFKVFGDIDFSEIEEWEKLLELKEIRNCIAHEDGLINESNAKARKIVEDSPLLSLEADMLGYNVEDNYLRIQKEYVKNYFGVVESFLTKVSKEI